MVGKDDLETYEAVNRCETFDELAEVILSIGSALGSVPGRTRDFQADKMVEGLLGFAGDVFPPNVLTRRWGIRQQAMYIKHYSS